MGSFRYPICGDPSQLQAQLLPEHNTHSLLNSLFYDTWKTWSLWESCPRVLELLLSSFVLNGLIGGVFIDHNHLNNRWNKKVQKPTWTRVHQTSYCVWSVHQTSTAPAFPVTIPNHMWCTTEPAVSALHHPTIWQTHSTVGCTEGLVHRLFRIQKHHICVIGPVARPLQTRLVWCDKSSKP
jgi:hypothetical protein